MITLIRKIERRFEASDKIKETGINCSNLRGECALELIECDTRLQRCHRVDQVRHGLRLNQIHLAVHECAQGEFARPRQSGPSVDRALQYLPQDDRAAMRAQLDHVLACVGTRRRKPRRDHLVDWSLRISVRRAHARKGGVPRLQRLVANQNSPGYLARVAPADAYDAQASSARRGRNRDDGVVGRKHTARCLGARMPRGRSTGQRRAEIITVFMNASPMLSELTDGSSAIVRCTMRRS